MSDHYEIIETTNATFLKELETMFIKEDTFLKEEQKTMSVKEAQAL